MNINWFDVVSLLINVLLGGGLIVTLVTLQAQKQRAMAEAKGAEANTESTELDNVDKAARIWRELAEKFEQRNAELQQNLEAMSKNYQQLFCEVEKLRKEVSRQNTTMNKILKILDSINHDNLEQKVAEAKEIAS